MYDLLTQLNVNRLNPIGKIFFSKRQCNTISCCICLLLYSIILLTNTVLK